MELTALQSPTENVALFPAEFEALAHWLFWTSQLLTRAFWSCLNDAFPSTWNWPPLATTAGAATPPSWPVTDKNQVS